MPRRARSIAGGLAYHILNRSNGRAIIFRKDADYAAFEQVLSETHARIGLRILSYCVMPNHWHFVVWPDSGEDQQVSEFFRWLTLTHTQRWHAHYGTSGTGHLYQGRFKSFPIESDEHLRTVIRYVERNALRANLVTRAEAWRWSSLWRREYGDEQQRKLLSDWPLPHSEHWIRHVNQATTETELAAIRGCIRRGSPYGSEEWCQGKIEQLHLQHTVRPRGRPRKA